VKRLNLSRIAQAQWSFNLDLMFLLSRSCPQTARDGCIRVCNRLGANNTAGFSDDDQLDDGFHTLRLYRIAALPRFWMLTKYCKCFCVLGLSFSLKLCAPGTHDLAADFFDTQIQRGDPIFLNLRNDGRLRRLEGSRQRLDEVRRDAKVLKVAPAL